MNKRPSVRTQHISALVDTNIAILSAEDEQETDMFWRELHICDGCSSVRERRHASNPAVLDRFTVSETRLLVQP